MDVKTLGTIDLNATRADCLDLRGRPEGYSSSVASILTIEDLG
jgi:hypothetical protein